MSGGRLKIRVAQSQSSLLNRYMDASQRHFSQVQHLTVALDGSRFGGREVIAMLFVAATAGGVVQAAWAPPQVSALL